jgi:hypothetical protein
LQKDLTELGKLGILALETPDANNLSYSFSNILIKDVLYDSMLFGDRREIHKSIAEIYEKEHAGKSAYYPILGYHFTHAEKWEEALHYLSKVIFFIRYLNVAVRKSIALQLRK